MKKKAAALVFIMVGALLWARQARAGELPALEFGGGGEGGDWYAPSDWFGQAWADTAGETWDNEMGRYTTGAGGMGNMAAFLRMIQDCEGTTRAADPYRVCYAYAHTIQSFADHPAITGEWRGERLTDQQCRGAGLGPGCVSTAAGAYQIIKPTWQGCKAALGLRDFSPASQDAAAIKLIEDAGAYNLIQQGRIVEAIDRCKRIWASLPGAGYAGQGMRTREWALARYESAGGAIA